VFRNGRLNREAFAGHVEAAGEGDLEGALHVWVECTVGGHVLLEFDRIDEYFCWEVSSSSKRPRRLPNLCKQPASGSFISQVIFSRFTVHRFRV